MSTKSQKKKWVELGDIIEITSPDNPEWHENIFFVSYIDTSVLELIELKSFLPFLLHLSSNGGFEDKSIQKVKVLSRSSLKGYARQNGLLKNTWIDLFFGGDVPKSITAEITNLEEDMIELTTYPENEILYIDFAYQGVPRNIPLKKICIRQKPSSFHRGLMGSEEEENDDIQETDETQFSEPKNPYQQNQNSEIPDMNYTERLQKMYDLQQLEEDEELQEVIQQIEIPPEQQQYGINAQVNDLLDAFLSTIPDYKRTPQVMNKIYTHIQRFKELREQFSIFDKKYHQILGPKRVDTQPLIDILSNIKQSLLWCIPVVSQTKTVYGNFTGQESFDLNIKDIETDMQNETENENNTFYKNNIPDENIVKYANMYIQNYSYTCPFTITDFNKQFVLNTLPTIQTDIDVIVSTDIKDELTSHASKAVPSKKGMSSEEMFSDIITTNYGMERYNTETQYPYKKNIKSKEPSLFATLFPSDSFAFRSLVTLPEPFIAFSKIRLSNTNILQKSILHRNYPYFFHFLNQRTNMKEKYISLSVNENDDNNETNISFSQFQHYKLSPIDDTAQSLENPDKLIHFLKKTIPTLNILVNDYLQKQKRKIIYTFLDAVDMLEPFCIYFENMDWKISNTIKTLLYKNIDAYKTDYTVRKSHFQSILLEKYKSELQEFQNTLLFLLEEQKEQQKKCMEFYENKEKGKKINTSEWLRNTHIIDESKIFTLFLRIANSELYTSEDLFGISTSTDTEENIKKNECWKRVITKKYFSISALRADNNKQVIVDKEFDTTDYTLVDKYRKEQPDADDSEFLEFVAENLITKYHYERDHAYHTARNMIAGERQVEEGEYAILENHPKIIEEKELSEKEKKEIELESETKKRIMYFIRKKQVWIHVPELDELSFVDNNTLICNIQENCFSSSSSSKKKTCSDATTTLKQFREQDLEKMRQEFKNRYIMSIEDKKQELEIELQKYEMWIQEHNKIQQNESTFIDYQCHKRGTNAIIQEIILSPYLDLRDTILAKNIDFITRQNYIILFVDNFCREPMIEEPMSESIHWQYCKETNTKLMPKSLYLLAKAYKDDNYVAVLDKLCNTIGKVSDDGDAYIDKYSGYFLKKIEFRENGLEMEGGGGGEEGLWEEDGNIDSEKNFQNIVIQKKRNRIERIFLNEIDQKIYNIISTICDNIHLKNDILKDNMMQLCQQWLQLSSLFMSETVYMKKVFNPMTEKRKQNPKFPLPDTFSIYNEKLYIIISAISVLIIIQTSIPNIIITKTFSRCVKSFDGYPLKEDLDLSSIKYMGCVLKEMYSRNKDNLVSKNETFENNMVEIIKRHILTIPHILQLYDTKRKYLILNPITNTNEIEDEEKVENKWPHFLPPTQPFHIPAKELQSICPTTYKNQEVVNICIVKTRLLSLAFLNDLREIINKNNVLFQTKSGMPYLQNACCDEILQNPPISFLDYFKEQDSKVKKIIEIIWTTSKRIDLLKKKRKAVLLLKGDEDESKKKEKIDTDIMDTKKKPQNIFMLFESSIYYSMVIHYCKLESEIYPIPEELLSICSKKPIQLTDDYYDKSMSIVEKMDFLSKHQVKMDVTKAIELMDIVNKRNFVYIHNSIDIKIDAKIQVAIENFQEINYDLKTVMKTMKEWKESEYKAFSTTNKTFIIQFIKRNASIKMNENTISQKLSIFYNWENYKNIQSSNLLQKMKSIVTLFGIIYPSFLISNIPNYKYIPIHWEFTETDESYLQNELQKYKVTLQKYQRNDFLLPVFKNITERIQPLITILQYSDDISDIKEIYDKCIFCLELIFIIYIELITQPIIYSEIRKAKQKTQEDNKDDDDDDDDIIEEEDEEDYLSDNLSDIKKELSDFLLDMISTIKQKESFMMSYDDIITKMDYYRDREKQKIKNHFKNMTTEERKAEIILKKLHLGVFAIDTKKLVTYGKETGFYADIINNADIETAEQDLEDLGDMEFQQDQDEDDNLDIQQNEEDMEDINDNAYEDYFDSEYN
jgi:hypothetical protein